MVNGLYFRLARDNIRRNRQFYLPYCIATAVMSSVFFIVLDIIFSKSISNMSFGDTTVAMLIFGAVVMTIFTFGYMLYVNSFLIKRRKKEFGLYAILGLEKRHVGHIIFLENLMLGGASLLCGLLCGTVFGKLLFMLLVAMLDTAKGSRFELSPAAYIVTALIFAVIIAIATLRNQLQVRLANPIDLLRGEQQGEKKLRGVIPLTVVGVLCMGAAYLSAFTVDQASIAVLSFWPAVILVIAGTWALFTAGSQFVLTALKKNKKLYYKPRSFVTISGLMHRMKQNAAGLSNICILSTMVLVTVSGCCSLFFGQESILKAQSPDDYRLDISYQAQDYAPDTSEAFESAYALAEKHGVAIDDIYSYEASIDQLNCFDRKLSFRNADGSLDDIDYVNGSFYNCHTLTLEDYNSAEHSAVTLEKDEVLVLFPGELDDTEYTAADGTVFHIKEHIKDSRFSIGKNSEQSIRLFFVTADAEAREKFITVVSPNYATGGFTDNRTTAIIINFSGEKEARKAFVKELDDPLYSSVRKQTGEAYYSSSSIDKSREMGNSTYGGLLFLGILFSILFLTSTVLIIYFKQVSEGFEDRERFAILQKVGMSHAEVKATINRQVLIVFFVPLVAALMHIFAATNLMAVGLEIFAMTDYGMVMLCVAVTSAVFILLYVLVYRITARTYYRLVKW